MSKMGNEELTAEFIAMVNRGFENGQLEQVTDAEEVKKEDDNGEEQETV